MSLLSQLLEEEKAASGQRQEQPQFSGAILAVDIGSVHTRAILLDMVDGMYRFVARGEAPTTAGYPWNNALVGVQHVIRQITEATGRVLLDESGTLIIPEENAFSGVGGFVATSSGGKPIRAVLFGLMPDVSLISGRRAAASAYISLIDTFHLGDPRTPEQQIDALLKADADLVLIVGGTDGGAVASMRKQIGTIALAFSLMDSTARPTVLYAGNRDLAGEVEDKGDEVGMRVLIADNVRPTLDTEHLDDAQAQLASLFHQQKSRNTPGINEVGSWTEDGVFPTAHGFSRFIHALGVLRGQSVLGVDLGSGSTSVAAYLSEERYLNVFGYLGMGHAANQALNHIRPENLIRWLTFTPERPEVIVDYVWNKSLYPHVIPSSPQELEIEYALARELTRHAVLSARQSWRNARQQGLLPHFDTIVLSGSTLTCTPSMDWSALLALDALLPVGISRVLLDPWGIATALGMIAPHSPQAFVQTLETGAFIDLGTVISISGRARRSEIVLRGSLRSEDTVKGEPFEVRCGTITTIPLAYGQQAELTLQPRRGEIEGMSRRRFNVTGGELGLIIDARGRPWRFPRDDEERRSLMREWQQAITRERPS